MEASGADTQGLGRLKYARINEDKKYRNQSGWDT